MQAIFETVFDIVYLATVITLGILMIRGGRGQKQYLLFGIMAVMMGGGIWLRSSGLAPDVFIAVFIPGLAVPSHWQGRCSGSCSFGSAR